MSDTQVIIISGKKQSGKDTSCEFLTQYLLNRPGSDPMDKCQQKHFPTFHVKTYSFAEPLKRFLVEVMGLSHEQCWGTNEQKDTLTHLRWAGLPFSAVELFRIREDIKYKDDEYMSGREVMQVFGSNICRMMWPDCWANGTKNAIMAEKPKYAFICDARFPNEIEKFVDLPRSPVIVRLTRDPYNSSGHWSENALDKYDWSKFSKFVQIDNRNMTIEEKNKVLLEKVVPLL